MPQQKIIIIGAGAAGLIAARTLSKSGYKVVLLEARNRIGGRIHTLYDTRFKYPTELGAEFVHGKLPVTLNLLHEAGITYHAVKGEMIRVQKNKVKKEKDFIENWNLLEKKLKELTEDMSIQAFLNTFFADEKYTAIRQSVIGFSEGYDSADTNFASVFAFRDAWLRTEDEEQYRIEGGYSALMQFLATESKNSGCEIKLSAVVKQIKWSKNRVEIICNDKIYSGTQCIITVPLGVLTTEEKNTGAIIFSPGIPAKINSAKKSGYGAVIKIVLQFTERFWEELKINNKRMHHTGFLFSEECIPTWWTQFPKENNLLTGWLGGPKAKEFQNADEKFILQKALISLASIFKLNTTELTKKLNAWKIMNWTADAFTRGSYAYAALDTAEAINILNTSVSDTLFFAGEGLYNGPEMGTVEAAFISGINAADKVLKSIK